MEKFGRECLKKIKVKNVEKTFEYMDKELIQYIDATDNMQLEYLESKIVPDFIKLCNPEWNERITIDTARKEEKTQSAKMNFFIKITKK